MFTPSPPRTKLRAIGLVASFALLTAACGSDDSSAAADIATLESETSSAAEETTGATSDDSVDDADLSPDEAALAFSACMRDEGLDFPDLSLDADGNIELRSAFQDVDPRAEGFQEAIEVCGEILQQSTGFGGGNPGAFLESPEMQDALLAFSECVRDEGYDVGDLTLERLARGLAQELDQGLEQPVRTETGKPLSANQASVTATPSSPRTLDSTTTIRPCRRPSRTACLSSTKRSPKPGSGSAPTHDHHAAFGRHLTFGRHLAFNRCPVDGRDRPAVGTRAGSETRGGLDQWAALSRPGI